MADPVSIGLVALQAGTAIYGATSEAKQLRANAAVDDENAHLAEVDGARQSEAILRAERATTAEARAAMGMNGIAVDTGSALDLITQNGIEREYEILGARYQATQQATNLRDQAREKRKAAKGAVIGGLLKAGAAALSGYGQLQSKAPRTSGQLPSLQNMKLPSAGLVASKPPPATTVFGAPIRKGKS